MKIGIVSDTHSRELPSVMMEDFKKVDFIIHAGDFCSLDVLEIFQKMKEVKAVYGNMDGGEMRRVLPRRQIIECGKFKIGLFHGEGHPQMLLSKVQSEFKDVKVDVIIFGHSHKAMNEVIDGVLYFNPGSPNDTVSAEYCSYGILEIDEKITGKIIKVK